MDALGEGGELLGVVGGYRDGTLCAGRELPDVDIAKIKI